MEKKMRFGLDLGRLATMKKKFWADYEQLLRAVVSCFHGQKKLHKMKVRKPKKNLKKLVINSK